jgi:PPK2 family polyphosphate:nucleotide phosphotransferase
MIDLSKISTTAPKGLEKRSTRKETERISKRIGELQHLLYAQKKHSILVIFQGMDGSGKDGASRKVFRHCSITGIAAKSFKKPTSVELDHDFLWRVHQHVPKKGRMQIFNRSHYEDVLIQRVNKWIDEKTVDHRIEAINNFERNLIRDNNTTVLKFYLHISESMQKEKLQERIDNPAKNWKHNDGDWEERKKWKQYMNCYADVINRSEVPWIITPVDQRWYRDYFIASRIQETMESLDLQLPKLNIKKPSK